MLQIPLIIQNFVLSGFRIWPIFIDLLWFGIFLWQNESIPKCVGEYLVPFHQFALCIVLSPPVHPGPGSLKVRLFHLWLNSVNRERTIHNAKSWNGIGLVVSHKIVLRPESKKCIFLGAGHAQLVLSVKLTNSGIELSIFTQPMGTYPTTIEAITKAIIIFITEERRSSLLRLQICSNLWPPFSKRLLPIKTSRGFGKEDTHF